MNKEKDETHRLVFGVRREGKEGCQWGKIKAQLLTSLAAALLDPFGVCDVIMTSFAVEKCSKSDTVNMFSAPIHLSTDTVSDPAVWQDGPITFLLLWHH